MVGGKVLITGASGLLGRYLYHVYDEHYGMMCNYMVRGAYCSVQLDGYHYRMDVTDSTEVERIVTRFKPRTIIHCAAIGSVDYCETHYPEAFEVNVEGTRNVAHVAAQVGAKFVYISSNAVYKGDDPPYSEDSRCCPVNKYGWLKLDAERIVQELCEDFLIVRPIMLYGWPHMLGRPNWVTTILSWAFDGRVMRLVNDVNTQPTYAGDCAVAIQTLIQLDQHGIWNVGGRDHMTLYQMAQHIFEVYDDAVAPRPEDLIAVGSDHFSHLAPRPKDTTYDLTKLYELADDHPTCKSFLCPRGFVEGLQAMKKDKLK